MTYDCILVEALGHQHLFRLFTRLSSNPADVIFASDRQNKYQSNIVVDLIGQSLQIKFLALCLLGMIFLERGENSRPDKMVNKLFCDI